MPKYVVDIDNTFVQSFRIDLEVKFFGDSEELYQWKTWHYGYIRHNYGFVQQQHSSGTFDTRHILLLSTEKTWGIRLNDFTDFWGANDEGNGILLQPWSLSFKPGVINWRVVESEGGEF